MSYYLGGDLGALEESVCADAYFEGLQGAGDWISPSAGGARVRQFAQEQRNWAGRMKGSQYAVGGNVPRIIGAGKGDRVRDGKGWRDKTPAERAAGAAAPAGGGGGKGAPAGGKPTPFGPPKPQAGQEGRQIGEQFGPPRPQAGQQGRQIDPRQWSVMEE